MDMNSGKMLDEACNCYNDVYRDEGLYAPWAEPCRQGTAGQQDIVLSHGERVRQDCNTFMARLCACNE